MALSLVDSRNGLGSVSSRFTEDDRVDCATGFGAKDGMGRARNCFGVGGLLDFGAAGVPSSFSKVFTATLSLVDSLKGFGSVSSLVTTVRRV